MHHQYLVGIIIMKTSYPFTKMVALHRCWIAIIAQCSATVATLPGQGHDSSSGSCISPRGHPVLLSSLPFPCSSVVQGLHGVGTRHMSLVLINLCAIFHSYGTSLSIHVETVPTAVVLHAFDKEQKGDCIRTVLEERVMGKEKATIRQGTSEMANNRSPI